MDTSFRLNVTSAEWERIASLGSGVLFREGEFSRACEVTRAVDPGTCTHEPKPPAEFVEAAQRCDHEGHEYLTNMNFGQGQVAACNLCKSIDGKRRVAVVVPCPTCSIKQDGRIKPGLELCTRCVPRHWEFCSTCTVWSDDEFTITSKAGFVTVGHVVVTWGPLVVKRVSSLVDCEPDIVALFGDYLYVVRRNLAAFTIPPGDVDLQSLVGQWAIGIQVVS